MSANRVRVNLANAVELAELPGVDAAQVAAIVKYRAEHGPIRDATELASIIGPPARTERLISRADFSPAEATAPEAPGA